MATRNSEFFRVELEKNQKEVVNFLRENEISILVGEAGTGKDFMQMYRAIDGLKKKEFEKIVLIKPCIEVGKSMGYLPGESNDKTAPYEKSFFENIGKLVSKDEVQKLRNRIVFEPLNFIRGNTWDYSAVILSEAQNCTLHELVTITTRLSSSSKLYINGDLFQSDIRNSGLKVFTEITKEIEGVGYRELDDSYQMRNPMIVAINRAYRKYLNNE